MSFRHLNRRTHLYLALLLLPWFFMYGLSSLPFNHPDITAAIFGPPQWKIQYERTYDMEILPDADLQELGAQIMQENGLRGTFRTSTPDPGQIDVGLPRFINPIRISYFPAEQRLIVAERAFNWPAVLTGMHARGGFNHGSLLGNAWAVIIDLVCVGMLLWIASGIIMWWDLRRTRRWGLIALASGVLSFGAFLWSL